MKTPAMPVILDFMVIVVGQADLATYDGFDIRVIFCHGQECRNSRQYSMIRNSQS